LKRYPSSWLGWRNFRRSSDNGEGPRPCPEYIDMTHEFCIPMHERCNTMQESCCNCLHIVFQQAEWCFSMRVYYKVTARRTTIHPSSSPLPAPAQLPTAPRPVPPDTHSTESTATHSWGRISPIPRDPLLCPTPQDNPQILPTRDIVSACYPHRLQRRSHPPRAHS
jgi:hypothetical protein